MRWLSWIIARLGHPTACRFILALALVLALPSLASPLVMDEYAQLLRYRESTEPHAPSFLNTAFLFADPANRQRDLESVGMWWMAPDLKIAFWRPLAAFTQLIDFRLWPSSALLMHVHTLVWFALSLLAVAALYQRFLSQAAANLALAMYAWDDARGMVLSWIANRHALISTALGAAVLLVHDKWRRDGWQLGAWLGPVLLALSLLSSEMGLATTAFLLGYALFMERGALVPRIAQLRPYALVVVSWQVIYTLAGYGAVASGAYLH
ncbi:MAG TPA: hypothetical protein VMF89_12430, partial [Polyangiales bacterium]|nr:hypothetical protein [Polyangiales bacterium]